MADYQQKDLFGVLFKNQTRPTDKHPNLTGTCTINGTRYRVAAWTRTISQGDRAGEKYLRLSFTLADDQAPAPRRSAPPPADDDPRPY